MFVHEQLDSNDRFRQRRRQALIRRRRRRALAICVLLLVGAALGLGTTFIGNHSATKAVPARPGHRHRAVVRPIPREVRGVHVTMALASLPGKLDEYLTLSAYGLNTIELDVKDENGKVGFVSADLPRLASSIGAAQPYYDVRKAVAKVHAHGMYLIGRVVVFEDPTLTTARPQLALLNRDGTVWKNNAGLGWANEYDPRVWSYVVGIGVAAARAGFDEIQFDYVRFPSDGDVSQIVYRHQRAERKGKTIARFLAYASGRLHPLHVRVAVDVFGLSATHDLGIGQVPRLFAKYVDEVDPMVYPSHYSSGEYLIQDPNAYPGRIVAHSLYDFRRALRGSKARLVPWLQDFSLGKTYGLIEVTDQIAAARRQHAGGFLLWNPSGVYTLDALSGPAR